MKEKSKLFFKEFSEILKKAYTEKTIIETYLRLQGIDSTIRSIGYVKDIDCNYKNEFFEEIYEDENGNIIDLRLFQITPSSQDVENMTEYWIKLQETYKKNVEPIFIIAEKD